VDEERSLANHKLVAGAIRRFSCAPVALGSGASSLAHKVSALLFAWSLGRPRHNLEAKLREFCMTFCAFCADMGVGLGTAQFQVNVLGSLLPEWFLKEAV